MNWFYLCLAPYFITKTCYCLDPFFKYRWHHLMAFIVSFTVLLIIVIHDQPASFMNTHNIFQIIFLSMFFHVWR